jgi:hypothetical protein
MNYSNDIFIFISIILLAYLASLYNKKKKEYFQSTIPPESTLSIPKTTSASAQDTTTPTTTVPSTSSQPTNGIVEKDMLKYSPDNLDMQYHSDPQAQPDAKDNLVGYKIVKNSRGENVEVPYAEIKGETLYHAPGSVKFGPSSYVPNYEESVYLSKLTNESPFSELVQSSDQNGFCKQYAQSPEQLEEKCNQLSHEICSSTNCCIHFGGAKCVAGNEQGPLMHYNYNDPMVKNRDFYYYKGKCYGHCPYKK